MELIVAILLVFILLSMNRIGKQLDASFKKSAVTEIPEVEGKKDKKLLGFRRPAGSDDIFEEKREALIKLYAEYLKDWISSKEKALIRAKFEVYNFDNEEIRRKINSRTYSTNVEQADEAFYKTGMLEHDIKERAQYLKPLELLLPLYEIRIRESWWFESMKKQNRKSRIKQMYSWEEKTYLDFIKHNALMYRLEQLGIIEDVGDISSHHLCLYGTLTNANISELKKIIYDGSDETPPEDSILDKTVQSSIGTDWEKDCNLFEIDPFG